MRQCYLKVYNIHEVTRYTAKHFISASEYYAAFCNFIYLGNTWNHTVNTLVAVFGSLFSSCIVNTFMQCLIDSCATVSEDKIAMLSWSKAIRWLYAQKVRRLLFANNHIKAILQNLVFANRKSRIVYYKSLPPCKYPL